MFDRNMNDELELKPIDQENKEDIDKDKYDKIVDAVISNNNMVYIGEKKQIKY
jgi:hypothetical protein